MTFDLASLADLIIEVICDEDQLLTERNGTEGFLSHDEYIMLWSAPDIGDLNEGHVIAEVVPGVTLLGTNGGNTGYGFRAKGGEVEYVSVPLIGMEPDEVVPLGNTLAESLERLRHHGLAPG